jgi:hypothetical protein
LLSLGLPQTGRVRLPPRGLFHKEDYLADESAVAVAVDLAISLLTRIKPA